MESVTQNNEITEIEPEIDYKLEIEKLKAQNQELKSTIDKWFQKPPEPVYEKKVIPNLLLRDLKGE